MESSCRELSIGIDFCAGAQVLCNFLLNESNYLFSTKGKDLIAYNQQCLTQKFLLKYLYGGPMKTCTHEHLTHKYFYTLDLR